MSKLYFRYATMNSGKSLDLIRTAFAYQERGLNAIILKPISATREEEENQIYSRSGLHFPCIPIDTNYSPKNEKLITAAHVVLVDEAQFLTAVQVDELFEISTGGIPVLCYGLRTDFQLHLFEGSKRLMELADQISEIKSICKCGKAAKHNIRIDANGDRIICGEIVQVGTENLYNTVCSECLMNNY